MRLLNAMRKTRGAAGLVAVLFSITAGDLRAQSPLILGSVSAASAQQGIPYTVQFTASGGVLPYIWSLSSGTLPPGISLMEFGMLSGTPTASGTYSFTVQVHDCAADQQTASASLSITVYPALSVPASSLPDGTLGIAYSQNISASGGQGQYTYQVAGGALPGGLSLNSSGRLFGNPTQTGQFGFSVRATDGAGSTAIGAFSLKVAPQPLTLGAAGLPHGIVSKPFPGQVLTATGGVRPYVFAASGSNQPPGLSVASDGSVSGTPLSVGVYSITVTVTDSLGAHASADFPVTVDPLAPTLLLSTGSLSFTLSAGNTVLPEAQAIGVQSSDITKILPYLVALPDGPSWLTFTAGSGVTPGVISVALLAPALSLTAANSPYQTNLIVSCPAGSLCAGKTLTVGITLTVSPAPPQLTVTNDSLSFTTTSASPQAGSQSLGIKNSGGGSLGIASSTSCGASWCHISAIPGAITAGATSYATVTADPAGLTAGYYLTSATVVSSVGSASVPVSLLIAKTDTIGLAPGGNNFTIPSGAPASVSTQTFLVISSGASAVSWNAAVLSGGPWLQLSGVGSGTSTLTQPGSVGYLIDPASASGLGPGTYYGTIRVTSSGVVNSPQDFQVVLNVVQPNELPKPYPSPAGVVFTSIGGAAVSPAAVGVFASSATPVNYQASASTSDGGNWLSVFPTKGSTSASATAQSTISVQPGLAPGIYTGGVSYAFEASAVRTVNVTLIVEGSSSNAREGAAPRALAGCTPSVLVPTQTGLVNNFEAPAAWPTPLAIQLLDDCGNPIKTGQLVATFSNGDAPLVLPLADGSSGLYAGTWSPRQQTAQMAITSRASAPGFATVSSRISGSVTPNVAPSLQHNGTLNVFAPQPGAALAPGTLVQINGSYLAAQTSSANSLPLPGTLGGTSVIIGGIPAPISSVSPSQISAQVPFELDPDKQYQVIVSANGALATPDTVQLQTVAPGVKSTASGFIQAQHANATDVTETVPAAPGESISLFVAGMGLTDQTVASGTPSPSAPPAQPVVAPSVTVDSTPAVVVSSVLVPGQVGLYRIVITVPPYAKDGDLTLAVTQGTQTASGILPVHQ